VFFGLTSALGFGIADLFGAVSTRRLGVPWTVLIIQALNTVLLSLLLLTPIPGSLSASPGVIATIVAAGLLGSVSYFSFFRALQLGPVAIVSPVFASYAALTVVLAIVLGGERVSALAGAAIAAIIVGVILASARGTSSNEPLSWGGIPFALVATLAWGVASYLFGRSAQEAGWFLPLWGLRVVEFAAALGVVAFLRTTGRLPMVPLGKSVLLACASGLADNAGVAAYARGSQVGLISITGAVSASFPLIVIAGSLILFRERPSARQWVGVLLTVGGLITLGVAR
jgi:drug/metabolite transporter (DMT)-like permease